MRDDIAVVTIGLDVGSGVAAKLIGRACSLLGRTMEAERRRQLMQQPGVIAIPVILVIELPITGEALAAMAEQDDWFGKQAIEKLANRNIEKIVERFSRGIEGPENHAPIARHAKLLQGVGAAVKVFRHAANSGDPSFKRDPNQITAEVVAPVVINTGVVGRVAAAIPNDERAAVGAAVNECVQRAIFGTIDDHGGIAGIGGFVVARIGDLGLQAEKQPNRSVE